MLQIKPLMILSADNLGFTLELCRKVKIIILNKQSFLSIFLGGLSKMCYLVLENCRNLNSM